MTDTPNPLPGNPHYDKAVDQYEYVGESWMSEEGITDATMIAAAIHTQAHATLALAFEVRTATLAMLQVDAQQQMVARPGDFTAAHRRRLEERRRDLHTRLGLGGDDGSE